MSWTQLLTNILTLNEKFETIEEQIVRFGEYQRDLEARHYALGLRVARIEGRIQGLDIQGND